MKKIAIDNNTNTNDTTNWSPRQIFHIQSACSGVNRMQHYVTLVPKQRLLERSRVPNIIDIRSPFKYSRCNARRGLYGARGLAMPGIGRQYIIFVLQYRPLVWQLGDVDGFHTSPALNCKRLMILKRYASTVHTEGGRGEGRGYFDDGSTTNTLSVRHKRSAQVINVN